MPGVPLRAAGAARGAPAPTDGPWSRRACGRWRRSPCPAAHASQKPGAAPAARRRNSGLPGRRAAGGCRPVRGRSRRRRHRSRRRHRPRPGGQRRRPRPCHPTVLRGLDGAIDPPACGATHRTSKLRTGRETQTTGPTPVRPASFPIRRLRPARGCARGTGRTSSAAPAAASSPRQRMCRAPGAGQRWTSWPHYGKRRRVKSSREVKRSVNCGRLRCGVSPACRSTTEVHDHAGRAGQRP
jgi:hypothetical protein